jgi:SAM-dependent methyltransferase
LAEIGEHLSIGRERVRQIQNVSLSAMGRARRAAKLGAVRSVISALEADGAPVGSNPELAAAHASMASAYEDFEARDYKAWLERILRELRTLGLREKRLLDAACGTGKRCLPVLQRGWEVSGSDVAEGIVKIARETVGGGVPLMVADLPTLPVLGEFDLVWALGGAVNCLCDGADLDSALAGLGRNLGPGGLLVFDTSTLLSYRTFFAQEEALQREDSVLIWTGMTDRWAEAGVIAEASLEVKGSGRPGTPAVLHRERHYPEPEVRHAVERAGMVVLDVFGHGYDAVPRRPLDESRHIKAVYVAGPTGRSAAAARQDG